MPEKKTDRRTNRTRRRLSTALVELVKEKRFDDITVQNVIDRADVGRSTFYSHFRDKEDLFQRDWERFLDSFAANVNWHKAGVSSFVPATFLFSHLQDAQAFYKGLVRSRMTDTVFKFGVNRLSHNFETALNARQLSTATIPIPILANYLASELFTLLKWWLDHDMPYPPQRMDEIFHELVNPTFRSALARD